MKTIEVIIETPKGSAQKYDYVPERKLFKLVKILPAGMVFPYDFGFIPDTKGEDGDPLDILVLSEFSSFPGCIMECRLIGAIKAKQSSTDNKNKLIRNDRFIAIPIQSELFKEIENISDLPKKTLQDIQDFFINYNKAQDKIFEPLANINYKDALTLIKKGI